MRPGRPSIFKDLARSHPRHTRPRHSPEDWHSRQRQETVAVTFRFITKTGQAIAVTDGTEEADPKTGELREKLAFLPRAHTTIAEVDIGDTEALNAMKGATVTVTTSESLLKKWGLI